MTTVEAPPRVPGRFRPVLDFRRNLVQTNERLWRQYGDLVRLVIGPPGADQELLLVSHPDAAAAVLGGSSWRGYSKQNPVYHELRHWLGNGLLSAEGDDWTRQKRFLQPLFTKATVDGCASLMVEEIEASTVGWAAGGPATVDLGRAMSDLTLRVVVRALFGDSADRLIPVVTRAFPPVNTAIARRGLAALRLPAFVPTPLVRRVRAGRRELFAVCDEIVAHRRTGRTSGDTDLLGRLLAARDGDERLSDTEVRDQVLLFLLAGFETTAIALTFALHLLGRHLDVQDAVRAEVVAAGLAGSDAADAAGPDAAGPDAALSDAAARRMVLTEAVLKEAMRLYPSAPILSRQAVADDVLLGRPVRAGTDVGICVWNIHRRPDLWPDPLTFDPTRFLPDAAAREHRHRYAWMPFGAGPRACIGQHFSLLEGTLALAAILRRYRLTAVTDTDHVAVDGAVVLYPLDPVLSHVRAV